MAPAILDWFAAGDTVWEMSVNMFARLVHHVTITKKEESAMFAQRSRQLRSSTPRKRRLGAEMLESRHMLSAGSVMVAPPVAGLLTITGDTNNDAVLVSGGAADPGTFKIQGLHGTKINGVVNGSVTETGVNAIATAGWGNGNDSFGFTDNNATGLAGGLSVTMGNGNDEVNLGKIEDKWGGWGWGSGWGWSGNNSVTKVGGDVQVTLGNGNDGVDAENFMVNTTQGFLITTGNGNDRVDADNVTVTATGVSPIPGNQGFGVMMGDGNDSVDAEKVTVNATGTVSGLQGFGVSLGNGNDRFSADMVSVTLSGTVGGLQGFGAMMGNGNDRVSAEGVTVTGGQGFGLSLGNGNDDVDLGGDGWAWGSHSNAINVTGAIFVQLGTGQDYVDAYDVTAGGNFDIEKVEAGGGGARIELDHVTVGTVAIPANLIVNLSGDTGRDELGVSHTTVTGTTTFTGGSGTNDDYDPGKGNSFATPPVVTGFEH